MMWKVISYNGYGISNLLFEECGYGHSRGSGSIIILKLIFMAYIRIYRHYKRK